MTSKLRQPKRHNVTSVWVRCGSSRVTSVMLMTADGSTFELPRKQMLRWLGDLVRRSGKCATLAETTPSSQQVPLFGNDPDAWRG